MGVWPPNDMAARWLGTRARCSLRRYCSEKQQGAAASKKVQVEQDTAVYVRQATKRVLHHENLQPTSWHPGQSFAAPALATAQLSLIAAVAICIVLPFHAARLLWFHIKDPLLCTHRARCSPRPRPSFLAPPAII